MDEKLKEQHHAAPTCGGWWWARYSGTGEWTCVRAAMRYGGEYVAYTVVGSAPSPVFDRWVGPLRSPGDAD